MKPGEVVNNIEKEVGEGKNRGWPKGKAITPASNRRFASYYSCMFWFTRLCNIHFCKGKRRYPKGVGAPKQPLSGYVHFLNERRESVRSKNPDITFSDLSKKLAAEWSALSETDKNKYNEMAKRDKYRYIVQIGQHNKSLIEA